MAAGKPIVASALPSIKEILNQTNAVLVSPDSPSSLVQGIKQVIDDKNLSDRLSKQTLTDVQNYTWDKRAQNILTAIQYEI